MVRLSQSVCRDKSEIRRSQTEGSFRVALSEFATIKSVHLSCFREKLEPAEPLTSEAASARVGNWRLLLVVLKTYTLIEYVVHQRQDN